MGAISKLVLPVLVIFAVSCTRQRGDDLVFVKGGPFLNKRSAYFEKHSTVSGFSIGAHEVTQKEWAEVMGDDPSFFKGDDLPVETVSWYACVGYCNKRSLREGLKPYYKIDSLNKDPNDTNTLDDMKWTVTIDTAANGYRLPTEMEWEYAAGGGQRSKGFVYSGSDSIDGVAWYWKNSGDTYLTGSWSWAALQQNNNRTRPVGSKAPNELGLYDMSGNVREWCWDPNVNDTTGQPPGRIWKGGGWMGADFCCASAFRAAYQANGKGPDQGLRVCRDAALAER